MPTFRCVYWLGEGPNPGELLMTGPDEAHRSDDELMEIALQWAEQVGVDEGGLTVGYWTGTP